MSERRRDLLGECNADAHPIDTFTTECCANCFNPGCTRSLSGKLKFDQRVSTWYDRFFGDQDKMLPGDPRFTRISGQKFLMLDPGLVGRPPEIGASWVDPRDLDDQATGAPVKPVAVPTNPRPPAGLREVPRQLLLANSPRPVPLVIQAPAAIDIGRTAPAPPVQKDPWAPPGPAPVPASDVPVIQPGARVKLGGPV